VGASTEIAPLFRPDSFDVAFVDAMHERPHVDVDMTLAAGCLRAGGLLALHDYGRDGVQVGDVWHPFGVTEAVDELVSLTGGRPPEVVDTLAVLRLPTDDVDRGAWRGALARFAPDAPPGSRDI
jgi:hypothetical protein